MTYLRDKELEEQIFVEALGLADEQTGAYGDMVREVARRPLISVPDQVLAGLLHRALDLHVSSMLLLQNHPFQVAGRICLRSLVELYGEVAWLLQEDTEVRCRRFVAHQLSMDKLTAEAVFENESGPPETAVGARIVASVLDTREKHSHGESFRQPRDTAHFSGGGIERLFSTVGTPHVYRFIWTPMSSSVHSSWTDIVKNRLHTLDDGEVRLNPSVGEPLCVQVLHGVVVTSAHLAPLLADYFSLESVPRSAEDIMMDVRRQIDKHEAAMAHERSEQ